MTWLYQRVNDWISEAEVRDPIPEARVGEKWESGIGSEHKESVISERGLDHIIISSKSIPFSLSSSSNAH
ncbi:uncharacterized protein G2W53_024206 [Senna tora]|uniref:Uncharacterized protein n=1 Tax=Senna tora TaxID=362788 RepID=A0A834WGR4_9FABA|nr:uncharacterized protein G2W53_024206 [Senna tora]